MGKYIKDPPRINAFKSDTIPQPFKKRHKPIKSVHLDKISLDEKCERDLKSGNGFLITNEVDYDEKKKTRTVDGLFSPKFGADAFSAKSADNMYHCECGELVGGINEGDICPKCGTEVKFVDADLSITGYIPLGDNYVISPSMYLDIERLIGKKELDKILKYSERYDISGHQISLKSKSSPYSGMGFKNFKENFDEVIEYYRKKKKDKIDSYNNIQRFHDCVFTKYVAVFSAIIRPYIKDESRMSVFDANKKYSVILANANIIREPAPQGIDKSISTEKCLYEIQNKWNDLFKNMVDDSLAGKKGLFRGQIASARIDKSARTLVIPGKFLNVNEIVIPYILGCEFLRPLLINAIKTIDGKNIRDANDIINKAIRTFDPKIYLLMNHILQESTNPPKIMVQRSPSLLQESMRLMDIKYVKADINDLTTEVPIAILTGMNADFDGDTFAEFIIFDNRLKEVWETVHSPYNHFVSRHDGKYNSLHLFIKDTIVSVSEIWELGKNSSYYTHWATERERNALIEE